MRCAATSKAYVALLPALRDEDVQLLDSWAGANCSRSSGAKTTWIAMRERPRDTGAFCRHVRGVVRRLGIECRGLGGRWLQLLAEEEALEATGSSDPGRVEAANQRAERNGTGDDPDDALVISLAPMHSCSRARPQTAATFDFAEEEPEICPHKK